MLNNHDARLKDLARYLVNFAPAGAEREINRLHATLARNEVPDYIALEFRPTDDTQCQLYVRAEGPEGRYGNTRIEDAEGNLWYAFTIRCEVSWPSWGTGDIATCQRRLALMTLVTRFAADIEREFAGVFHHLVQTKAERDAQVIANAKNRAEAEIKRLVVSHAKGMKVGQTKSFYVGPGFDLTGIRNVQVERTEGGRTFKYDASLEHGYRTGECGLVYFMRLDV